MSPFADSSALVKLYIDEPGFEVVRPLREISVSALARVEVPAAVWRKRRTGALAERQAILLIRDFEADLLGTPVEAPRFPVVRPTTAILDAAARLIAVHELRAYDAVQLSSAMAAEESQFACFDKALRTAAATEGLTLIP